MASTEINKFRQFLSGGASELTAATRRRDAIVIELSAEELERSLLASAREAAMQNLEGDSVKLREVRAAMRRIDEGAYGICAECHAPISAKRLAAVPAAALCIGCQEALDCGCGAGDLPTTLLVAA